MTSRDQVVRLAAIPIAVEIDAMLAQLPAGIDLAELASELIDELAAMCDRPEFARLMQEAVVARRALLELGVKI